MASKVQNGFRRSRDHQLLLLGVALGNQGQAKALNPDDFDPDLGPVVKSLLAKINGSGDQTAGKDWARLHFIDWDKPMVEQLKAYVGEEAARVQAERVVEKMHLMSGRPNSRNYMEQVRQLMGQMPKVSDG